MVISAFEWDSGNTDHIDRHEYTPEEVEEALWATTKCAEPATDYMSRSVKLLMADWHSLYFAVCGQA